MDKELEIHRIKEMIRTHHGAWLWEVDTKLNKWQKSNAVIEDNNDDVMITIIIAIKN